MTAVRSIDHGYAALVRAVFGYGHPEIAMGILAAKGDQTHRGGPPWTTVLDVGTWNEFGTDTIPARSFIRAWFDAASPEMRARARTLLLQVMGGKLSKEKMLQQLGLWGQGEIQERIAAGIDPPNAPETANRKGSSTPLIASGQLRGAISFAVRER